MGKYMTVSSNYKLNSYPKTLKNMKKILLATFITALVACENFEDPKTIQESSQDSEISMLAFSSSDDFLSVLDEITEDDDQLATSIITRAVGADFDRKARFVNMLEPVNKLPIDRDPILQVDCKDFQKDALIVNNDLTLYEAKGYDSLVPNIKVAKLLNARAEIKIDATIFKVSPRGTYYYPESKQAYFEENYERFEKEDGTQIDSCTYQLENDILRYNTFEIAEVIDYEDADLPDEIEGDTTIDEDEFAANLTRTSTTSISIPWSKYPTYNADAKTWVGKIWQKLFGRNKSYTYKLSKKRRLRAKFYYYNYIFYSEIGALGEMQKKNWIGWSGTKADELFVGWHNIVLYSDYKVKPNASLYPKNPKPTVIGSEYKEIPGFNKKGYVVSIFGLNLTQNQINKIISMSSVQLFNWLKSELSNGKKLSRSQFETVMFYTPTKVITIIPDNGYCGTEIKKYRKVFASDFHILVSFSPINIPSTCTEWLKWAQSICENSMELARPELKYGEVRVAGRLGNTWGAIRIRKQ
ncbi:MAG: hypothetical protein NC548_30160 [Lachnospiraceae bacterium]|nr:hypothetical protein [Lachnospiraceae bacterium]